MRSKLPARRRRSSNVRAYDHVCGTRQTFCQATTSLRLPALPATLNGRTRTRSACPDRPARLLLRRQQCLGIGRHRLDGTPGCGEDLCSGLGAHRHDRKSIKEGYRPSRHHWCLHLITHLGPRPDSSMPSKAAAGWVDGLPSPQFPLRSSQD